MNLRNNARAIIINPEEQILLLKLVKAGIIDPSERIRLPYWLTPGGGVEMNENLSQTIAREILEECGIYGANIGPKVWFCEHELIINGVLTQSRDHYFLVRTTDSHTSRDGMLQYEHEAYSELKWWTVDEIKASTEMFAPPNLGYLLENLLKNDISDMHLNNISW